MRNPFARPQTTPQWLLGSACWPVAGGGGWLGLVWLLDAWPATEAYGILCFPGGFVVAQALVWQRVIRPGWALLGREGTTLPLWYKLLCYTWFGLLILLALSCLLLALWVCWLAYYWY